MVDKPVQSWKEQGIDCAIWSKQAKNAEGESFTSLSISLSKSYKDKNGEWQRTNYMNTKDLPIAIDLLSKALLYCTKSK